MEATKLQRATVVILLILLVMISFIVYHMETHVCEVDVEMNGNADAQVIMNELGVDLGNTTQLDGEFGGGFRVYFKGPCYMINRLLEDKE